MTQFRNRLSRPWRRAAYTALAASAVLALAVPTLTANAAPAPVRQGSDGVVTIPVAFTVKNVNRSKVPCASDGKTYTVRGSLIAPSAAVTKNGHLGTVTLYLHGLSFGQFFWQFNAVGGYDYARNQARAGLSSVVIDRLGYGHSDKPLGTDICVGSRADIAHQMVLALKSGTYRTPQVPAPRFGKVVLAGHSYGGQIAQVEAYSFGDIDGLVVISYTDLGQSKVLQNAAAYTAKVCAAGGVPVATGGPGGYAPFGPPAGAAAALFHTVDPRVLAAALPKLTLDPCGDTASFAKAASVDKTHVQSIRVPVLLISGGSDALFPPPALARQAGLYTGTQQLDVVTVPATAHAITLEKAHSQFERSIQNWVHDNI